MQTSCFVFLPSEEKTGTHVAEAGPALYLSVAENDPELWPSRLHWSVAEITGAYHPLFSTSGFLTPHTGCAICWVWTHVLQGLVHSVSALACHFPLVASSALLCLL